MSVRVIGVVAVVLVLAAVVAFALSPLVIKDDAATRIVPTLGILIAVALFLERATEVFLSASRSGGADNLDHEIEKSRKIIAELKESSRPPESIAAAESVLGECLERRTTYRITSRQWALWGGLLAGTLIAAVGLRSLNIFFTPDSLKQMNQNQKMLFAGVDVLLTGALLAGGSDGLHKITEVYTSFMNSTAKKARGDEPST